MSPRRFLPGSHPGFVTLRTPGSTLYHSGDASLPWATVQERLERGAFPTELRGNFAFVWEGPDDTVAAVDHLATIPLFYSDTAVAPLFHELQATIAEPRVDGVCFQQMRTLLGHSIGERTTVAQIARLVPGHSLARGKQVCFLDLGEIETDEALGPGPIGELVEMELKKRLAPGRDNALLLSAGTDSTALAGVTRKLGLEPRFDYLHLYSDRQWLSEARLAQRVAQEMQLPLRMIRVRAAGHELPDEPARLRAFWLDDYFAAKVLGVRAAGHEASTLFTGELGDQLFGGPKTEILVHHLLARGRADARELAAVWLNQAHSWGRASGFTPSLGMQKRLDEEPGFPAVLEELTEHLARTFREAKSRDLLNRVLLLNLVVKGPFRLYPSSQDPRRWALPFAAWSVVEQALRTPSRHKIAEGGTLKAIYRTLWGPWLSPIPWQTAKSGMRIPMKDTLAR